MAARRSRGPVAVLVGVFLAGGAVVVLPGPTAGARPASSIVSAVEKGSSLTLRSGATTYLYVGGSSANAVMSDSSFGSVPLASPCGVKRSQAPLGTSSSSQGSFISTGTKSAIAGVAETGYTVTRASGSPNPGGSASCASDGLTAPQTEAGYVTVGTKTGGGTVVVMVGGRGVASLGGFALAPGYVGADCAPLSPLRVLRNVTFGNPRSTIGLGAVAAVAVLAVTLPAHNSCSVDFDGTDVPLGNAYALYEEAYLLTPVGVSV